MIIRKIFSLFVLGTLFCAQVSADFVSQEDAFKAATDFFNREDGNISSMESHISTRSVPAGCCLELAYPTVGTKAVSGDIEPSFYIFNRTDGNGFVIVSAETGMRQILAYSYEDIFHTDQMELGAKPFLDSYRQMTNSVRSGTALETSGQALTQALERKVLKTADFDQTGYSFNSKFAPKIKGRNCYSGCVATAMAIIMKYHKWPERNSGSYSYVSKADLSLNYDFAGNPFKWEKMTDIPNSQSSDAISMLLKACGISVRMEYGVSESSASLANVVYALKHYFYYDYPMYILRDDCDDDTWDKLLHDEIDADRPVCVCGESRIGGHAYVIDGYDIDGTYHYNLGWGGYNNGFYYDGAITSDKFVNSEAIIGIKPRTDYKEDFTSPLLNTSISTNANGNLSANSMFDMTFLNLANTSNEEFRGLINVDVYDKDLHRKFSIYEPYDHSDSPLEYAYYWYYYDFPYCFIPEGKKIEPTDKVMLSTSIDGGSTWQPVYSSHPSFQILAAGGYETDLPHYSQMMFTEMETYLEVESSAITQGSPFSVSAYDAYNLTRFNFDGDIMLAVCDTCNNSIIHILKSDRFSYGSYYGLGWHRFSNVVIPSDLKLKRSYALKLLSKAADSQEIVPICFMDYTHKNIMLSDYMDIPDGINISSFQPGAMHVIGIDGRETPSDNRRHGIYIIRHDDGTVTKEAIH